MNAPCRTTVAPSTPRTAAANGRTVNSRGSTAGWSLASSNLTNRKRSGTTATAASDPNPPSPAAADRGKQRDEQRRQQDQASDVDRSWLAGGDVGGRLAGRADPHPIRRDDQPDHHRGEQRDRDGDHEQRPPAEGADEDAADERPDRGAGRDEHVEGPECGTAPVGRRHRADERDRRRRDQRPAHGLEDARQREELERWRDRRQQRRRARRPRHRRGRRAAGRIGRRGCRWPAARR